MVFHQRTARFSHRNNLFTLSPDLEHDQCDDFLSFWVFAAVFSNVETYFFFEFFPWYLPMRRLFFFEFLHWCLPMRRIIVFSLLRPSACIAILDCGHPTVSSHIVFLWFRCRSFRSSSPWLGRIYSHSTGNLQHSSHVTIDDKKNNIVRTLINFEKRLYCHTYVDILIFLCACFSLVCLKNSVTSFRVGELVSLAYRRFHSSSVDGIRRSV